MNAYMCLIIKRTTSTQIHYFSVTSRQCIAVYQCIVCAGGGRSLKGLWETVMFPALYSDRPASRCDPGHEGTSVT